MTNCTRCGGIASPACDHGPCQFDPVKGGGLFRKKPVVVKATQWHKNGDHPADNATEMFDYPDGCQRPLTIREGAVVRYYRHPGVSGKHACKHCGSRMHEHGWIDTLEGGHIVCPGDWIITGVLGERYPCKPDIFAMTYEPARAASDTGASRDAARYRWLRENAHVLFEEQVCWPLPNGREIYSRSPAMCELDIAIDSARASLSGTQGDGA